MGVDTPFHEEEMTEVSIDKTSMVYPATPTERHLMFLTSCDLVCRSYPYINRIFFYKCEENYEEVVASLKRGLERTLVVFFPLAGRFSLDEDAEKRLQVDCNDAGVEFVEATAAKLAFQELDAHGFQHCKLFWRLARRTELLRSDYLHLPILSIQVTKFGGGGGVTGIAGGVTGIAVGVSLSHVVADAQSFYDFVKCWADSCRGVTMTLPPRHMRTALSVESLFPNDNPAEEEEELLLSMYMKTRLFNNNNNNGRFHCTSPAIANGRKASSPYEECGVKFLSSFCCSNNNNNNNISTQAEHQKKLDLDPFPVDKKTFDSHGPAREHHVAAIVEKQQEEEEHRLPRTDLVQRIFSFSAEALQRLKARASNDGKGKVYTTFESFCAHWWQCLIRAKDLTPEQPVFLLIPINCRQRFLGIPKGYFGNSLDGGLVKSKAGELCKADLPSVAGKISEAIKAVTEESFLRYIKEAEARRNAIPHFDRRGLFHVVDSPKYLVYETNFGWGKPCAVRAEGFRFGAEVQILQGRLGDGCIDLFCALDPLTMQRLEQDAGFLAC